MISFLNDDSQVKVENDLRLCSGETVALFYDFNRLIRRGAKSNGSYNQFSPVMYYFIEVIDKNNNTILSKTLYTGWTREGQYQFLRIPTEAQFIKLRFMAQNSKLIAGQKFFDPPSNENDPDKVGYIISCPSRKTIQLVGEYY